MMATGVVFDKSFTSFKCLWDDNHVEKPKKYELVVRRCEELGLLERCSRIMARPATMEELSRCHDREYINLMKSTQDMDTSALKEVSSRFDCVYLHPNVWEAATRAAGGTIDLVRAVISGEMKNGMALVRPPGHHALRDQACGYCYFNNVALGAREALEAGLERILIVDWDVHHGQGTQRQFYDDNRVMYVSIHRHEEGYWWPNLHEADYDHVGEGAGAGFNVNIPLNVIGNTDTDYLHAWHQVVLPVAFEFQPQLILISAGFDPAIGCPEGEQEVSPATFAHFAHSLMGVAEAAAGRVCAVLEGGYFPLSLAEGAALTLRTILGDPCPLIPTTITDKPNDHMRKSVLNVQISLSPYWKVFSHLQGRVAAEKVWRGPAVPDTPPYDIMCPTPPRGQEVEDRFTEIVRNMISRTNLTVPSKRKVHAQEEGVIDREAVERVCSGEASVAHVSDGGWEELLATFDTVFVKIGPETITACGNKRSEEIHIENLCQTVNMKLLPLLFIWKPEIIVLKIDRESISDTEYCVQQLQSLSQGRMILNK